MQRIYFHYQNLNDAHPKRYWSHGRFWLGDAFLHAEWHLPAWRDFGFRISLNNYGDTAIGLSIGLFFFWIHLCTENRRLYKWLAPITKRKDQTYTNGRDIGVSLDNWALRVSLWSDSMEHRSVDPKWWNFVINFKDIFLGKKKHSLEILGEGEAQIDMPEGIYPATYKIEKRTWKRPRWFSKSNTDIWFDIPAGIPHEGKGENSWDMDMNATFGIGTDWGGNIHEAAKRIALRCLASRSKTGSLSSPAYAVWRDDRMNKGEQ